MMKPAASVRITHGTVTMRHGAAVRMGRGEQGYTGTSPEEGERARIWHAISSNDGTVTMRHGAAVRMGRGGTRIHWDIAGRGRTRKIIARDLRE